MEPSSSSYSHLLERTRLPQPSLQRYAVIALFEKLCSAPASLGLGSDPGRDALSRCLRAASAPAADQAVRELCRLVRDGRLTPADGLVELQAALEGCEPPLAPLFVKGIGFVSRLAFRRDPEWGLHFDPVEFHPFVKVFSCRAEVQNELIQQVLLFIVHSKSVGIEAVLGFLRPFILFSIIRGPLLRRPSFIRDLFASIASLSCSSPWEATPIIKLLIECLMYFPCNGEEEFRYLVGSAEYLVDAIVVVLKHMAHTDMLAMDIYTCCMKLLHCLLSLCTCMHKPRSGTEIVLELSKRLLIMLKELGWHYMPEFALVVQSISIILTQVEFEHEHLSILKFFIFLVEWKAEYEKDIEGAAWYLSSELLFVFPVIDLLSSPSRPVKAAASYLLSAVERLILDLQVAPKRNVQTFFAGFPSISKPGSIVFKLLNHLWSQERSPYLYYHFIRFSYSDESEVNWTSSNPNCWTSQLRQYLLSTSVKLKSKPLSQSEENWLSGISLLTSSVASILVMHPTLGVSAVDSLDAIGVVDPKLCMPLLVAILFYTKMICGLENNSSKILLKLLEVLPQLASHSIMAPLIVQTFLPMLRIDAKSVLYSVAVRLLCKTWLLTDRAFGTLQGILDPKAFSDFVSERDICISIAASIRDVCKHNPDKGVDLILSVSSSIESRDSTVQALGFESLAYLCEADVVDFYTAWSVISKHTLDYSLDPIVAHGLCTLLRWGAMDAEAYLEASKNVIQILWDVGSSRSSCSGSFWAKARASAFNSLSQYEVLHIQEAILDFKKQNFDCLVSEDNAEVLKAMERLQTKILNFEHINRRRALKDKKAVVHKVEKLLDAFPQVIFPSDIIPICGKQSINASEMPGACLLSLAFIPKDLQGQGTLKNLPKLHNAYENALVEIAESLNVSRNILFAMLALQSWKPFIHQWVRVAAAFGEAKVSSNSDKGSKAADDIFKIMSKVAVKSIPRVAVNIALAIGALCMVVPPSAHATISAASKFLLKWLLESEHEHQQWSGAISLGLISTCFHPTDRNQKTEVISALITVIHNSKSHLVKGACGVGLGFASQGLLSRVEVDDSSNFEEGTGSLKEASLLKNIVRTLSVLLCQMCPSASDSLRNIDESFTLGLDDIFGDDASNLSHEHSDDLEEDTWGVAGLVLGLGNCVVAMYRYGAYDAVLRIQNIFKSWIPNVDSSVNVSFFSNELAEIPLAIGSCLTLPAVVAFCQRNELMDLNIDDLFNCYYMLISELPELKKSGTVYQNLLMASCIGAGSLLSFIISDGGHAMKFNDVKRLLEILRATYTRPHPPIIHFSGMLGVANAFGAGIGEITPLYPQRTVLQMNHEQDSSFIRGPILSNPVCEPLSASLIQEIFLIAKDSKDQQIRSYAAWALSFLRQKWCSKDHQSASGSHSGLIYSNPSTQNFDEDNLVWKFSSWMKNISTYEPGATAHASSVATVLRCLSKAPRLPALDWGAIIRHCMRYGAHSSAAVHREQDFKLLREECVSFSISHANNNSPLMLFLDELTDLPRFRRLELNLQSVLLQHLSDILKIFSALRLEKLFEDLIEYFNSSASLYLVYDSDQKSLLRVAFWKGLYLCLVEASKDSVFVAKMEKCMQCVFYLLPLLTYDGSSGSEQASYEEEWSEATRCLAKARHDWLMNLLQISNIELFHGRSHTVEFAKQISLSARLARMGRLSFSELGKLKAYILNAASEGVWWTVLVEVIAALFTAEVGIQRKWLLDALEISCITEYPSTALRFVGLLSGSCCKYMPLLIVDPFAVLSDLPVTLPCLLSDNSWTSVVDSLVDKLWASTERICRWAAKSASNHGESSQDHIDGSETQLSSFLAQVMNQTCLSLKDYLPLEKQLRLAMLLVS